MKTSEPVILFTRDGCHLCERAADLLDAAGVARRAVDIDGDAALTERYGLVIPVLRRPGSGRELAFPFDAESVAAFLAE